MNSLIALASFAAYAAAAGVIELPFIRYTLPASTGDIQSLLVRDYVRADLDFQLSFYQTRISIGTPPQSLAVDIDTGSSDLWVYGPETGLASFNSSASKTYKDLGDTLTIGYGDGTNITGPWGSDNVCIGHANLTGTQFAISSGRAQNGLGVGLLGIGQTALEANHRQYSNVPLQLKEQGYISRNAYSLYLNPDRSESGAVLFGGIDTAKISGKIAVLPITMSQRLTVNATLLNSSVPDVLLDSGTTYTYFNNGDMVKSIADYFGAVYDAAFDVYALSELPTKTLPYVFGTGSEAVTIEVPASDIFLNFQSLFMDPPPDDKRYGMVIFEQDDGLNILGDSFLRSAYVVVDMDSNEIGIGQSRASSESSIKPLNGEIPRMI